jgi:myo-inositol-1(or 4)-monophosphatase
LKLIQILPNSIRCLGSAALNTCYVANGSAEIYYEFGIHIWDMAACYLIAREAGCAVLDPSGGELDLLNRQFLVASSLDLAKKIIPLIKCVAYESD